jgi:nicotinate phosphoribosyltransferase
MGSTDPARSVYNGSIGQDSNGTAPRTFKPEQTKTMNDDNSALLTDLYQLTMLQGYFLEGMTETASFELFVRKLPRQRNFLIAAGLEQAVQFLQQLHITEAECDWLAQTGRFRSEFIDFLAELRFTGDVDALPEGTAFFPDEPIIRVTAPLPEAQFVETRLINLIQFQTMIASKAARCVLAAPGKLLVDFGLRRAHGAEAGLLGARACYIAGFTGSSNVLAAQRFGIPMYGTMAHSYVMAHDDERSAFEQFARSQPEDIVLLIDTYDTEAAAEKVVELASALARQGHSIKAVRLDSGDLVTLSKRVRTILDRGDLPSTGIFASGDLDEFEIARLLTSGSPIDGFGVGTRMITAVDAPYLNCAYKLQEYAGRPRRKYSEGKQTWPGCKQVFRHYRADGSLHHDLLTLEDDAQDGDPLLLPVIRSGRPLAPEEPLPALRERVVSQLDRLPGALRAIDRQADYRVDYGAALKALAERMAADRRTATHG